MSTDCPAAFSSASASDVGTGTGGYRTWVESAQRERGISEESQPIERNAHGAYVHIAATQGLVGLALVALLIAALILESWPSRLDHETYQAGITGAIIAVMIVGIFATVHLHTQTAAVLGTFAALSMRSSNRYRPPDSGCP